MVVTVRKFEVVTYTCDKCQDEQKGGDASAWRRLQIEQRPCPSNPLGSDTTYDLCPGCAGMLEHFMGIGVKT